MSDAAAERRAWARRVIEAYEGWPEWVEPGAGSSSGWAWGIPRGELEDLDRHLRRQQRTGEVARALQQERTYWGLGSEHD